jgi:hypothetical protein
MKFLFSCRNRHHLLTILLTAEPFHHLIKVVTRTFSTSVVMFHCTYLIIYLTNCIFPLDYSFSPIRYSCSFLLFFYKAVCCKSSVSLILLIYSVFCNWGFANLCKILLTVINTEAKNILLRHIYQHAREKVSFESLFWYR